MVDIDIIFFVEDVNDMWIRKKSQEFIFISIHKHIDKKKKNPWTEKKI